MTELSLERAARNEAVFRDANELLEERRAELAALSGRTPFLCECSDPNCKGVISLTVEEYEHVREQPNRFVLEPGHSALEATIVEEHEDYHVVEKHGVSRRVVEQADPRG